MLPAMTATAPVCRGALRQSGAVWGILGAGPKGEVIVKATDLKGRAVVTLSDAIKVGRVDDVLLDAAYREVLGFRIKAGTFSRLEAVSRANVTGVGHAALTVRSPDVINVEDRLSALAGAVPLSRARGTKVVTEGGELLGTISEIELDDEARTVTAYRLAPRLWNRLRRREPRIEARQVLRLGEGGLMIVPNSVAERIRPR
jgi:sporulation protein YlmC with PRC-barrel domain